MEEEKNNMMRKIVGILVCTLLIATATSVTGTNEQKVTKQSPMNFASALTFSQVDFILEDVVQKNSEWGHVEVNIPELTREVKQGYLNAYTDAGWVLRNEFINQVEGMNYLSMYFNLGVKPGEEIKYLVAYIDFNEKPYEEFKDGPRNEYEVNDKVYAATGVGDKWEIMYPVELLPFTDVLNYNYTKPNLNANENVQTAHNQCFPMAIANSLQYLENKNPGFIVPHDHIIGLNGDDSLVGKLDEYAGRYAPSRTTGDGLWFVPMMEGKFQYLADNGLADKLTHKHQGYGYGETIPPGDFNYAGITSHDESDADGHVTFDWIENELRSCEDLEIVKDGHAVRVFGCGKVLGKPYLRYKHDSIQTGPSDPDDTRGLEEVQVYVEDTDGDGMMNWGGSNQEIWFAFAESVSKSKPKDSSDGKDLINSLLLWLIEQFPMLQQLLGL